MQLPYGDYDLRSRINTYKQLVTVTGRFDTVAQADSGNGETRPPYQSSVTIDYDKTQVTQAWVYALRYESSDPSVLSVDPSSGALTGVRAGQATVLVQAVKLAQDDIILLDTDGSFLTSDGSEWDGTGSGETSAPTVVMTKEVPVTVTPSLPDSSAPEDGYEEDHTSPVTPTPTPTPTEEAADTFTDVKDGDWFRDSVNYVVSKGYFNGTGNHQFSPFLDMTRSMFVTVLGRLEGIKDVPNDVDFSDVPADMYYAPYVSWAASAGLVEGTGDGRFQPDASITREQAAKILGNYLTENLAALPELSPLSYADRDDIADWALNGVVLTTALGIFQGDDQGKFRPKATITRAEVAAIIQRLDLLLHPSQVR